MIKNKYRVGLIGCGLIGRKRIVNLPQNATLHGVYDIDEYKAKKIKKEFGGLVFSSINDLLNNKEINVVLISTPHNSLFSSCKLALNANKNIFKEKTRYKNLSELLEIESILIRKSVKIGFGFNHRFHRAMIKAKQIIDNNEIGELMFMRSRYGHGGRLGYEKEWRANPEISGGGELLDQGSHVIDLTNFFLGKIISHKSDVKTFYWDMKVDDNAFMILNTQDNKTSFLHVSCSEWRNTFSLEIYGIKGKIEINGLGGSYGTEKITLYKMRKEMGPPDVITWEYLTEDDSWKTELNDFFLFLENKPNNVAKINDALASMRIIKEIYKDNDIDYST